MGRQPSGRAILRRGPTLVKKEGTSTGEQSGPLSGVPHPDKLSRTLDAGQECGIRCPVVFCWTQHTVHSSDV